MNTANGGDHQTKREIRQIFGEYVGGLAIGLLPLFADTLLSIAKSQPPWSHLLWLQEILFASMTVCGSALLSFWMKFNRGHLQYSGIGVSASVGLLVTFFTLTSACMAYGLSKAEDVAPPFGALQASETSAYPQLASIVYSIALFALIASFVVEASLGNSMHQSTVVRDARYAELYRLQQASDAYHELMTPLGAAENAEDGKHTPDSARPEAAAHAGNGKGSPSPPKGAKEAPPSAGAVDSRPAGARTPEEGK